MTIFNPEGKDMLTVGECLEPAMRITDQEDADQYFEDYARYLEQKGNICFREAVDTARSNLGYFAGYYDHKTAVRVANLFGALHPIFGATQPTSEEAFNCGKELARSLLPKTEIKIE